MPHAHAAAVKNIRNAVGLPSKIKYSLSGKLKIFIYDLVAVVMAAALLLLPDIGGYFWPAGFIALLPLLLRIHKRSYKAQFFIPFFAFFFYLTYVMVWVKLYGIQWLFLVNLMNSMTYALAILLYFFIRRKLKSDLSHTILPILFVLAEYGKSIGFLSFPWPFLHHGQYANLAFIQVAEFTGAWGVTFLLIWFNTALFGIITSPSKKKALCVAIPVMMAIAASYIYGFTVISQPLPEGTVQVSFFQRDFNTQREWSFQNNKNAWDEYRKLTLIEWTDKLNFKKGGFIIWPEGAIPDAFDDMLLDPVSGSRRDMIQSFSKKIGKTFVIGTQTYDERGPYNTAAVFGPDGVLLGLYRKVHIVPFGEVIPLEQLIKSWFPDYPWGYESLVDGRELKTIQTPEGRVGIVICYESFYADLTRRIVADDSDFLFLITNTSWFGESNASYQHAHYDVFRAVENRIWLSRAATTGVSSFIDPYGRRYDETGLYVKDSRTRMICQRIRATLYTRWGDWFPRLCLIATLAMLTMAVYRKNE